VITNNIEVEKYLLCIMINKPELITNICNEIGESDFFSEIHRNVFRTILKLKQTQKRVDIGSIFNEVKENAPYIAQIPDVYEVLSVDNWKHYADTVRKFSMVRGMIEIAREMKEMNDGNVDEIIGKVISGATKIADNNSGSDIRGTREVIGSTMERIEKAFLSGGKMSGYDTGFESLNRITDGLQKEFIIIGARASVGKTALALNLAKRLIRDKIPTGYFSLEMSGEALQMRLLSDLSNVPMSMIRAGTMTEQQAKRVADIGMEIMQFPLYTVDKIRGEIEKIISRARYMVRVMGVKVIFIDHASLIRHSDRRLKRYEQFTEISNELQALQRELNIPLVLLAQLGRDSEGQMPTLADLRESGSFEQDADMVMLIHRERVTDNTKYQIPTKCYVAKNRNGACGVADVMFLPQYVRFEDERKEGK